jgi:hypothetical protein
MTATRYLDGIYLTWDLEGDVNVYRSRNGVIYELLDTTEMNYIDDAPYSYEPYYYKITQGTTEETAIAYRPYVDNFLIHNQVQYLTTEDLKFLQTEDGKFITL